jgi:hypothetical protein
MQSSDCYPIPAVVSFVYSSFLKKSVFNGLHGAVSQKTEIFVNTAVRSANPIVSLQFLSFPGAILKTAFHQNTKSIR